MNIQNNLGVVQQQSLPPLIKQSATYKLFVPKKVEEKIRYLCRLYPRLEWSGILFYKYTGSFEKNNLEIHCEDFFPMDLGSATFTDFKMDASVAGYIASNIELFDCEMGLAHSHNQMSCFFSGTDTATLRSEGNDTNCFVSLIVNNAGTYCAAITRKIQKKAEVVTKNLGTSYEFFGNGAIQTGEDSMSESTQIIDNVVIEYFMLDVQIEHIDNPLAYLDARFDEIEANKKKEIKAPVITGSPYVNLSGPSGSSTAEDQGFFDWLHSDRKTSAEAKEAVLFDKEIMQEMIDTSKWQPDPTIIHYLTCQLLTCSLIVNKDIDLKQWVAKHMEKKYDEIFGGDGVVEFENWVEVYVDFIVNHYSDSEVPAEVYDDWDTYLAKIAKGIMSELDDYQSNGYIDSYVSVLNRYANMTYE